MSQVVEGLTHYSDLTGNAGLVGGRKHMKKVSAKTIRRHLHHVGLKPKFKMELKGGKDEEPVVVKGGKKEKKATKKRRRRHASASFGRMFGL